MGTALIDRVLSFAANSDWLYRFDLQTLRWTRLPLLGSPPSARSCAPRSLPIPSSNKTICATETV